MLINNEINNYKVWKFYQNYKVKIINIIFCIINFFIII